ncbi:5-hydroxyisourate hydrolase [Endobacter medicaginis]|uniref:5-hydroxyisourate hydrolase n=1 Tax=Endobacter medicaginis TaxID=1181271 RepID=A0A850NV38_9PROT|nr:hydroxyisourate hydrolase [Endobacter medicaginis]MBB3173601.1 5-hydroxyisourate hydrolase [Endobacter medicaginis]MCX5475765.1 hydroxyisourate hydrolase [Endobacter medicaginis]NVN32220.1 hydroxyisourate hydrolase [Endobacter medicaginis]
MTGKLSTHVLDTATGQPGAGMRLDLFRIEGEHRELLGTFVTNADGRCDAPLLAGEALRAGTYALTFHAAEWRGDAPGFYDEITIRFVVDDPARSYHVPLALSPFGYSTYRGS